MVASDHRFQLRPEASGRELALSLYTAAQVPLFLLAVDGAWSAHPIWAISDFNS